MIPGLVFAGLGTASWFAARARQRKLEASFEGNREAAAANFGGAYNLRQQRFSIGIVVIGVVAAVYGLAGGFDG